MARDGGTAEAARAILAAQMPTATKIKRAALSVDNSGSKERLRERVREVIRGEWVW